MPVDRDVVLAELRAALPPSQVLVDADVVERYRYDEAEWAEYGTPLAVVRTGSTAEVAGVVGTCARHGVPIVPRGAGTGLSGGANAVDGCVVLTWCGSAGAPRRAWRATTWPG